MQKEELAELGYNINVTGRHVQITEGMKQHARDHIEKLERVGNRIIDVHVIMDIQKLNHRCDIVMKYGHTLIKSHAITTDMYVSIDQAIDRLSKQLKRYKKRLTDHHARKILVEELPVSVYAAAELTEEEKETETHHLVSSETRRLKTLTIDEAIMKMDLSQEPFLVFRGEEDRRIKIIYLREDENYGLLTLES